MTESDNILACYLNTYMHHDNYSNLLPESVLGLTLPLSTNGRKCGFVLNPVESTGRMAAPQQILRSRVLVV